MHRLLLIICFLGGSALAAIWYRKNEQILGWYSDVLRMPEPASIRRVRRSRFGRVVWVVLPCAFLATFAITALVDAVR